MSWDCVCVTNCTSTRRNVAGDGVKNGTVRMDDLRNGGEQRPFGGLRESLEQETWSDAWGRSIIN